MNDIQITEVNADAFALNMAMTKVFEAVMKPPEPSDDGESEATHVAAATVQRTVAGLLAQGASGFRL